MQRKHSLSRRRLLSLLPAGLASVLIPGCGSIERRAEPGASAVSVPPSDVSGDADLALPPSSESGEPPPLLTTTPSYGAVDVPSRPRVLGDLAVPLGRRWDYIVVHHSFSRSGSEAIFDRYHKQKGWLGVGYHFVIGNGHGSGDGATEVTFRWEEQIHGAHAGVKQYNEHGIGICLVGDFEHGYPTAAQLASLVSLVNYLQERCRIPTARLMLHRQIKTTKCPGRNFPYYEMVSLLDH
ncbi:MAG: peptidoglycan recognition family protein [Candidatus Brocadiia bacterium]